MGKPRRRGRRRSCTTHQVGVAPLCERGEGRSAVPKWTVGSRLGSDRSGNERGWEEEEWL